MVVFDYVAFAYARFAGSASLRDGTFNARVWLLLCLVHSRLLLLVVLLVAPRLLDRSSPIGAGLIAAVPVCLLNFWIFRDKKRIASNLQRFQLMRRHSIVVADLSVAFVSIAILFGPVFIEDFIRSRL